MMRTIEVGVLSLVLGVSFFGTAGGQASTEAGLGRSGTLLRPRSSGMRAISSLPQAAENESREHDHSLVLTLLLPETAAWIAVGGMPEIESSRLGQVEPKLKEAYWKSKLSQRSESAACSLINRLFEKGNERFFHVLDADADGIDDIIYSGPAMCSEGRITIIWFRRGDDHIIRQDVLWQMEALRISPGDPPKVGSVEIGCCDSPYDTYFSGTLNNFRAAPNDFRMNPSRTVTKYTKLPRLLTSPVKFAVRGTELVLRSSPETDNRYEEGPSHHWGNAVFGNILSKYLPGCGGTILGKNKEGGSDLWYFVLLDECEPFRIHSPFEVNVGWVEASQISPMEQGHER